ncbi:MAG: RNA polymerase sigma factor [Rhodovibrionaceae bacterium]
MELHDARAMLAALLPRLRRLAAALTGSTEAGDPLVAATLQRAFVSLDSWPQGMRFDSWVFRLLQGISDRPEWRAGRGEGVAWRREDRMILHNARLAVAELPEAQRLVLALVDIEGLSYSEAARTQEIPLSDLTVYLARARAGLAHALDLGLEVAPREAGRAGFPDDLLIAAADGELTPQRLSEVKAAIDRNPELQRRSALLSEAGKLAEEAFQDLLQEDIPSWLEAELTPDGGGTQELERRELASPPCNDVAGPRPGRALLLAVLAAGLLILALVLAAPELEELATPAALDAGRVVAAERQLLERKPLGTALDRRASSQAHRIAGGELRVFISFLDGDGRYCRYYEAIEEQSRRGVIGVACREEQGWRNVLALAASGASLDALRPEARGTARLESELDRLMRAAPLLGEEEGRLIRTGWPAMPR